MKPNREALDALITKPEVELILLQRVRNKTMQYGQNFGPDGRPSFDQNQTNGTVHVRMAAGKIDIDGVVDLYEHYLIPLTKEVEVSVLQSLSCRLCPSRVLMED